MEIEYSANFSDLAKSLCEGLLNRTREARLGYLGWKEVMKHPFFAGFDFEALGKSRPPAPPPPLPLSLSPCYPHRNPSKPQPQPQPLSAWKHETTVRAQRDRQRL
jgi:hypothetical protein